MPRAKVFTVGLSAADPEFPVKLTTSGTHPARMIMPARATAFALAQRLEIHHTPRHGSWSVHAVVVHLGCTLREIVAPEAPEPVTGNIERTNDAAVAVFRGRRLANPPGLSGAC